MMSLPTQGRHRRAPPPPPPPPLPPSPASAPPTVTVTVSVTPPALSAPSSNNNNHSLSREFERGAGSADELETAAVTVTPLNAAKPPPGPSGPPRFSDSRIKSGSTDMLNDSSAEKRRRKSATGLLTRFKSRSRELLTDLGLSTPKQASLDIDQPPDPSPQPEMREHSAPYDLAIVASSTGSSPGQPTLANQSISMEQFLDEANHTPDRTRKFHQEVLSSSEERRPGPLTEGEVRASLRGHTPVSPTSSSAPPLPPRYYDQEEVHGQSNNVHGARESPGTGKGSPRFPKTTPTKRLAPQPPSKGAPQPTSDPVAEGADSQPQRSQIKTQYKQQGAVGQGRQQGPATLPRPSRPRSEPGAGSKAAPTVDGGAQADQQQQPKENSIWYEYGCV